MSSDHWFSFFLAIGAAMAIYGGWAASDLLLLGFGIFIALVAVFAWIDANRAMGWAELERQFQLRKKQNKLIEQFDKSLNKDHKGTE